MVRKELDCRSKKELLRVLYLFLTFKPLPKGVALLVSPPHCPESAGEMKRWMVRAIKPGLRRYSGLGATRLCCKVPLMQGGTFLVNGVKASSGVGHVLAEQVSKVLTCQVVDRSYRALQNSCDRPASNMPWAIISALKIRNSVSQSLFYSPAPHVEYAYLGRLKSEFGRGIPPSDHSMSASLEVRLMYVAAALLGLGMVMLLR